MSTTLGGLQLGGQSELGGAASAPAEVSAGLVGWWKADTLTLANNDPVSSWTAAAGASAVQATGVSQPTYKTGGPNGKPYVSFDGTNDYLTAAVSLPTGATAFAVVANTRATIGGTNVDPVFSSDNAGNAQFGLDSANGFVSTASARFVSETGLATLYKNGSTSSLTLAQNEWAIGTSTGASTPAVSSLAFGAFIDHTTFFAQHNVAEIIVYNRVLSTVERQAVESYLATKYAISISSPADVVPGATGGSSGATAAVTAIPNVTPGATAGGSAATATVTAIPRIVPGATGGTSNATATVTDVAKIVPGATAGGSNAIAAITAIPNIVPGATGGGSNATATITAPSSTTPAAIVPGATGGTSNATASITAVAKIVPGATAGTSGATAAITVTARVVPGATAGSSNATGAVTVTARIVPGVTGGASNATGAVTATPRVIPGVTGGTSTATGAIRVTPLVAPGATGGASAATAGVTVSANVTPGGAGGSSSASAVVTAPLVVALYGHAHATLQPLHSASSSTRLAGRARVAIQLAATAETKIRRLYTARTSEPSLVADTMVLVMPA